MAFLISVLDSVIFYLEDKTEVNLTIDSYDKSETAFNDDHDLSK